MRALIGVGIMAYAGAGLYLSDAAEERFDLKPTDKDHESLRNDLRSVVPKISTVERGGK